ncbi:MAG: hypothetical protein R2867_25945 [Caldilineaceae bacterium]
MNTAEFILGQLLTFEMMRAQKARPHIRTFRIINYLQKERSMDNQLLIIALIVVGLVANFTVMTASEK